MPTTITLDGVRTTALRRFFHNLAPRPRPSLGDAWSDDTAAPGSNNAVADFTTAAFGWGVLAFAVGTAAIRGYRGAKHWIK